MCKEDGIGERAAKAFSLGSVEWDEHERGEVRQRGEMKEQREMGSDTCVAERLELV